MDIYQIFFFFSKVRRVLILGEAKIYTDFNRENQLYDSNISQIKKGFEYILENNIGDRSCIFFFSVPLRLKNSMFNSMNSILYKFKKESKNISNVTISIV